MLQKQHITLGLLRISMGFIFLWTFLDKLFGLGFATAAEKAWLNGGSPTMGFLKAGTSGPFASFFQNLAGSVWVDWLFMIGLLGLGIALVLGIGIKIAAYSGSVLMFLMWSAALPPKNNPIIDEHIIYILILCILYFYSAGNYLGFGKKWQNIKFVKKYKMLV